MWTPFGHLPERLGRRGRMDEQHDFLQAGMGRRTFLKGAALTGLAVGAADLWVQSPRASTGMPVSRHVAFGADPQRQAVVSFATPGAFRTAVVDYGVNGVLDRSAAVDVRSVRGVSTRYGHAVLPDLSPGQNYRYRVRLDDRPGTTATLTTAPSRPEPFTFTAFGDEGVSPVAQAIVGQLARIQPRFHLLAGDICYADSSGSGGPSDQFDAGVWDRWLTMIEPAAATIPWMCATGNHDMEPGYGPLGYDGFLDRFRLPGNGAAGCPTTYSFRYGNVGFIGLDSNDVSREIPHNLGYSRGAQTVWLRQQLADLRSETSGIDFVVVYFHHCAFSTNSLHGSEGGVRAAWVPLFDEYEVDLVINGHAHLYERTSTVRHGQVVALGQQGARVDSRRGTTYVTAGGGGAPPHGGFDGTAGFLVEKDGAHVPEAAPWSLPTRTTRHSFLAVHVTPAAGGRAAEMGIRALSKTGELLDDVTLVRAPSTS